MEIRKAREGERLLAVVRATASPVSVDRSACADNPIVPASTASVPFAVVPSTVTEPTLIAAYAEWDGTGASGTSCRA